MRNESKRAIDGFGRELLNPEEVKNCFPYLEQQLAIIQPSMICCLGAVASQSLLKTDRAISSLRGKFHEFNTSKVMCTYHPAYLLRNPGEKRKVWEDMKQIKKELEK